MKKQLFLFVLLMGLQTLSGHAQNEYWAAFAQQLNIEEYAGLPFKISAAVKLETNMPTATASVWGRTHQKGGTISTSAWGNFPKENGIEGWQILETEGTFGAKDSIIFVGGRCDYDGNFYFDDFKLTVFQNKKWKNIPLNNGDFENTNFVKWTFNGKTYDKPMSEGWGGFIVFENRATFTPSAYSEEVYQGKHALLITGKGYFDAPALLKKYVGQWEVEFIPEKSENTYPGAILKGIVDVQLSASGYVLKEQFYGRLVFDEEAFFNDVSQISYHPDLGKAYYIETSGTEPPVIAEGNLAPNGDFNFRAIANTPSNQAFNRKSSYKWINEDEYTITHQFTTPLNTVKMVYSAVRKK